MKKIAVIGASGKVGTLVFQKAMAKGFEVTAYVRQASRLKTEVSKVVEKDLFDLQLSDLEGFDAIVLAYRAPQGQEKDYSKVAFHLTDLLAQSQTRLIVVGGAGSMYLDDERMTRLVDTLPKTLPYYLTVNQMAIASLIFKNSAANVTFFSPAEFFDPEGKETGNYTLTNDILRHNAAGESRISYADYASALVAMIEEGRYQNEHIGIYENEKRS
ncbi:NAD(P)-dependent oxidoreductase [Lactococcus taiwanensis]|uniref:NAD(P)-dependent oxidoreductase n=1 Tax=Lactococcus taiwanensis TaxID=1151742 RepID=UPI003D1095CA